MKLNLTMGLAALLVQGVSAQNPIIRDQFSADPTARVFNGKVYLFPSHDISPLSAYVWMMLSVVQAKYNKDAHIGIMLSNLVPYFVALQIIWVTFFIIWAYAGIPIGPGVTMTLPAGILP